MLSKKLLVQRFSHEWTRNEVTLRRWWFVADLASKEIIMSAGERKIKEQITSPSLYQNIAARKMPLVEHWIEKLDELKLWIVRLWRRMVIAVWSEKRIENIITLFRMPMKGSRTKENKTPFYLIWIEPLWLIRTMTAVSNLNYWYRIDNWRNTEDVEIEKGGTTKRFWWFAKNRRWNLL